MEDRFYRENMSGWTSISQTFFICDSSTCFENNLVNLTTGRKVALGTLYSSSAFSFRATYISPMNCLVKDSSCILNILNQVEGAGASQH